MKRYLLAVFLTVASPIQGQSILYQQDSHEAYASYAAATDAADAAPLNAVWLGAMIRPTMFGLTGWISGFGFWLENVGPTPVTAEVQVEIWDANFPALPGFDHRLDLQTITVTREGATGGWADIQLTQPIDVTGMPFLGLWMYQTAGTGPLLLGTAARSDFTSADVGLWRKGDRWQFGVNEETVAAYFSPTVRVYGVPEPGALALIALALPFAVITGSRRRARG